MPDSQNYPQFGSDANLLSQAAPESSEGPAPDKQPIIFEVHRAVGLPVGATETLRTYQRGEYWLIAVSASGGAPGDEIAVLVQQGETVNPHTAIRLGDGGQARIPAVSASVTVHNAGIASAVDVLAVAYANCEPTIEPGASLLP